MEVPAEGVCPAGSCLPHAALVDVAVAAAALREPLRRAGSLAGWRVLGLTSLSLPEVD